MEDLAPSPYYATKEMGHDFLGLGLSLPPVSWLDVRVFYVRLSCCSLEDAPDTLAIRFGARPAACTFEINGSKIPCKEESISNLRRDRVDAESSEATYVGTDRLRTTGSLPFEVCHGNETLICGAMENTEAWNDGHAIDRIGAVGTLSKKFKSGWVMECKCAISSAACIFLKRRVGPTDVNLPMPSMEVYVAGRYCGAPVVLTQTVELVVRRKIGRRHTLDSIPESEELERSNSCASLPDVASQVEEHSFYRELDCKSPGLLNGYLQDTYIEGEEGEINWFNAGVRVGVGIGLGMCVGIGIGVGLMMRAYQSTTRTLKRRFF